MERIGPEHAGQRNLSGVGTRERRGELRGDTGSEPANGLGAGVLQEVGEQPASNAPGHAEVPGEDRGTGVESAVDVYLLVNGGPVARVLRRGRTRGLLHATDDLAGERAATRGVECKRRGRFFQGL